MTIINSDTFPSDEPKRPDLTDKNLTIGDLYGYAVSVTDPKEASDFFNDLVHVHLIGVWGLTEETAIATAKSNIGYYAGYYSSEIAKRVAKLYGALHPIFGANFDPSPDEAFRAGLDEASKPR